MTGDQVYERPTLPRHIATPLSLVLTYAVSYSIRTSPHFFFFFTHDGQIKSRDVLGAASCHGFQNAAPSLSARCTYCIHTIRCCWNMHRNYSFRFERARFRTTRSGDPPAAASAPSSRILHLQYLPRGGRPSDPWGYSDAGVVYCSQAFHEPMPRVLVMTSLSLILALERNTHP
jgi:hypothetical protein